MIRIDAQHNAQFLNCVFDIQYFQAQFRQQHVGARRIRVDCHPRIQ